MLRSGTTASCRLVLSSGSLVLRTVALQQPEARIGRRPYNDIALDDLTVSGVHAAVRREGGAHRLVDLGSRNGTWVNGRAITDHPLAHGDRIAIGVYRLQYLAERTPIPAEDPRAPGLLSEAVVPYIDIVAGPRSGEVVRLEQPITSVTGVGERVAVVARRRVGFVLTHVEGPSFPRVNGRAIGLAPHPLHHDDFIELGDTVMRFRAGAST